MEIELSKVCDAFICILYKSYLEKRSSGASLEDARSTGNIDELMQTLPKWSKSDIETCCDDLKKKGLMWYKSGDDTVWDSGLTDNGIIYMENRFKNKVENVIEHVKTIASFIPFVPFG